MGEEAHKTGRHEKLKDIANTMTLVDGSRVSALPRILHASVLKATTESGLVKWSLHTHFEDDRYVPTRVDITPDHGGNDDERAELARTLKSDRLYVIDHGYAKFCLFNEVVGKQSSYVCHLRDSSVYDIV